MTRKARAHYDGTNLVLEEPVDLPVGESVQIEIISAPNGTPEPAIPVDNRTLEEKLAALEHLVSLAVPGVNIPDEALRRENMYGDDGR
jgi:hypothetical protein